MKFFCRFTEMISKASFNVGYQIGRLFKTIEQIPRGMFNACRGSHVDKMVCQASKSMDMKGMKNASQHIMDATKNEAQHMKASGVFNYLNCCKHASNCDTANCNHVCNSSGKLYEVGKPHSFHLF